MFWARGPAPGNVGDLIGPFLYAKDTGNPPRYERKGNPSLITCGSTIRFAGPDTTVWGAGHMRESDHSHPQARYVAVRGPLTREMVLSDGGTCPPLYGDPALCLRWVYGPDTVQRGIPVLVPHYAERVLCIGRFTRFQVVSPLTDNVEGFVDQVAKAPFVASSSLHGLVIAHAYSVPVVWVRFSDEVLGDGFKFRDYFAGIGREPRCIDLRQGGRLTVREAQVNLIPPPDFDQIQGIKRLWEARPWRSV